MVDEVDILVVSKMDLRKPDHIKMLLMVKVKTIYLELELEELRLIMEEMVSLFLNGRVAI